MKSGKSKKIEIGVENTTRGSLIAVIDCIDDSNFDFPLRGRVFKDGKWIPVKWTIEGKVSFLRWSNFDIVFEKPKTLNPENVFLLQKVHLRGENARKAHAIVFERNLDNGSRITVQDLINEIASEIEKRFEDLLKSKQQFRQEQSISKTKTNG